MCAEQRTLNEPLELIKMIVEKEKICVNANTEPRKWTPLHLACTRLNIECVKYLLSQGANTSFSNAEGLDPMGKLIKRRLSECDNRSDR